MKQIPNPNYLNKYLNSSPLYPFINQYQLLNKFKSLYLKPCQKCQLPSASLVFLAEGLLKQYHRNNSNGNNIRFIQFIMPDTMWLFEHNPWSPIVKALEPTFLLYLPINELNPFMAGNSSFQMAFNDELNMVYQSGFFLSTFLQELKSAEERLCLLNEAYGQSLVHLSCRELAIYAGVSEANAYHFFKQLINKNY